MSYYGKWRTLIVAAVCAVGSIFVMPNFFPAASLSSLPGWLPNKQINLGLDLQGGSHLLLEVEVAAVLRERLEAIEDETRSTLRGARIGYTGLRTNDRNVSLRVRNADDEDAAVDLLEGLAQPIQNRLIGTTAVDLEVAAPGDGTIMLFLTEEAIQDRRRSVVEQSIEIVRRRIDETGTREPTIQRQGADRILVQLPGLQDPDRIKRLLGQTAKLVFRLVDQSITPKQAAAGRVPPGSEILEADDELDANGDPVQYLVYRKVMVSGENLVDAQGNTRDQQTNQPVVTFRFDAAGGRRFGAATSANVGQPFAIVLDGKVVSAPVIRTAILGGSGQISGAFTLQEAQDLALLLRAGALPAPLKILEERTVGPDLGADSVAAGKIASVIAFVLVMVFMVAVYGLFGLFANAALVVNIILIGGGLSALQATLTLPGIAGIVLTIGMAVDANVLIFERIREETRAGKAPYSAIEAGYKRALTTIIDSNVTTFIAALLLFMFGSGPVKGFAVTLSFGIASSMFTAIMLTRLLTTVWLRRRRPATLPL
jgi:preprotein translocase subunit SecD